MPHRLCPIPTSPGHGVETVGPPHRVAVACAGPRGAGVAPRYPGAAGSRPPGVRIRRLRSRCTPTSACPAAVPQVARFLRRVAAGCHPRAHGRRSRARGASLRQRRQGVPLVTSTTPLPEYSRHYGAGFLESAVWRWLQWFHRSARVTSLGGGDPGRVVRWGSGRGSVGRGVNPPFLPPRLWVSLLAPLSRAATTP